MTTIRIRNGAVTEVYEIEPGATGIEITHQSVDDDGVPILRSLATLYIDPAAVAQVIAGIQRAYREMTT
jgi:hypothetical protein